MCGRYALYGPISRARRQFDVDDDFGILPRDAPGPFAWTDRYNIAPMQAAPVIYSTGDHRRILAARWGLPPHGCPAGLFKTEPRCALSCSE